MQESKLYGVEKDDIGGRIAKLLYAKAQIKVGGVKGEIAYPRGKKSNGGTGGYK